MSTTYTPLRYPGGKSRLSRYIDLLLTLNGLRGGTYVEPFAGGAGAAINLLRRGSVEYIHLNDVDPRVAAFWSAVLYEPDLLCRLISEVSLTIHEWDKQRLVLTEPKNRSNLEIAFATLFMNRTNRSGILNGGMIGGRSQNGDWRLDARFNRNTLIRKITAIAALSERITIYNLDAGDFLRRVVCNLGAKTLVYLDPPYYKKGQELYENHYVHEDHEKLASTLFESASYSWFASYDNTPQIRSIYEGYRALPYNLSYSAGKPITGKEILFFNSSLKIPAIHSPLAA